MSIAPSTQKPVMKLDFTKAHTRYNNAAGKRLPGVTTILGIINKPALVKWANDMGLNGIDTSNFVQDAANKGTVAHAMIQCYLTGHTLDTSNIAPDVVSKAENAFIKFLSWWDQQGLRCIHSELQIISEEWQVGGTLDILAERIANGNLVEVDLKTGKGIYDEMKIQVCAYAEIYEEVHGKRVDEVWICRTGKDDDESFDAVQIHNRGECVDAFVKASLLYRALQKVK